MSKYDYLHALYQELKALDTDERDQIMRDIENRFKEAEEHGQDELSVTDSLGAPKEYASQYLEGITLELAGNVTDETDSEQDPESGPESEQTTVQPTKYEEPEVKKVYTSPQPVRQIQRSNHPVKMMLMAFVMFFFNIIFVLGPFVGIWGSIVALVAVGFALVIAGVVVVISGILSLPMAFISVPLVILNHPVLLFSFGFLITGIGGLTSVAMIYIIRFFGVLTARYAGWNLRIIRGY